MSKLPRKPPQFELQAGSNLAFGRFWGDTKTYLAGKLLTVIPLEAHMWARFLIGLLLAALPLREINLRSKTAVFWKALLLLYKTALSVRCVSHTHVSEYHLKMSLGSLTYLGTSRFTPIWLTMQHMAIWHPNEPKNSNFLHPQRGLM